MDNSKNTEGKAQSTNTSIGEETVNILDMLYMLAGNIKIIAAGVIVCMLAAFLAVYFFVTPLYEATASIYIISSSEDSLVDLSDLQISSQLTADYKELMLSRPILEDVIESLSLDMTTEELKAAVTITNTDDTRILCVTVSDADPQQAANIANELTELSCDYLPEIMETEQPKIVETSLVPTKKASPSYSRTVLLGSLTGLVLTAGFFVVRYILNDTLTTPDDVIKYFGIQPLANIPECDLNGLDDIKSEGSHIRKRVL